MTTHWNRIATIVLAATLGAALLGGARAVRAQEQTDEERRAALLAAETAEAEAELKSAASNQSMRYENYTGTLSIFKKPDPDLPGVIGTFKLKDTQFYLKLGNASLKEAMEALDGKEATLLGWSSNKGKYFTVTGQVSTTGAAPTPSHRKRGGL